MAGALPEAVLPGATPRGDPVTGGAMTVRSSFPRVPAGLLQQLGLREAFPAGVLPEEGVADRTRGEVAGPEQLRGLDSVARTPISLQIVNFTKIVYPSCPSKQTPSKIFFC